MDSFGLYNGNALVTCMPTGEGQKIEYFISDIHLTVLPQNLQIHTNNTFFIQLLNKLPIIIGIHSFVVN